MYYVLCIQYARLGIYASFIASATVCVGMRQAGRRFWRSRVSGCHDRSADLNLFKGVSMFKGGTISLATRVAKARRTELYVYMRDEGLHTLPP